MVFHRVYLMETAMSLLRVAIACASFLVPAAGAHACDTAGFKGLEGLRLLRPAPGAIVGDFGTMRHPVLQVPRFHSGLDLAAALDEPVTAAAKGRVVFARPFGEYGNLVRIDHGDGLATAYGHLNRIGVQVGECVGEGSVIGLAGSTGLASRIQVHFEVQVAGKHVDPAPFIGDPSR
jgi:murein DD-endopeptidase MepM/ murein hydrolase activator NlpD